MNIKSLLLGSAAALVAVSGARAADAVVIAEPEPVEYVRVCDVYGAGYFYIPGTETCLKISGYVWYQIAANSYTPGALETLPSAGGTAGEGWYKTTRARLNVQAQSETEWGTLQSYIRFQANWGTPTDGPVVTDQAWLAIGGLQMGYTESAWAASFKGGATNWGSHSWTGMYYGYAQVHQISYTFTGGNGFFATLSLEDDALGGEGYMPDVVAKVGVNQGWGSAWATVAYDESFDGTPYTVNPNIPGLFGGTSNGGFGASVGVQVNVPNMAGSSLRLIGYYADGAHRFNAGSPSIFGVAGTSLYGGAEWSILASYNHQWNPNFGTSVAFQYFNDLYYAGTDFSRGNDAWAAEVSAVWTPVTNFEIRGEVRYDDIAANPSYAHGNPDGTVSGFLRFTRYF